MRPRCNLQVAIQLRTVVTASCRTDRPHTKFYFANHLIVRPSIYIYIMSLSEKMGFSTWSCCLDGDFKRGKNYNMLREVTVGGELYSRCHGGTILRESY